MTRGTDAPYALEVDGLGKSYAGVPALVEVALRIRPGEIHALLGQNGSGKSTLVKALTGVHAPDAGTVRVFGREVHMPLRNPADHGIAVIHQDHGLVESMTVLENLGVSARYGRRTAWGWLDLRAERSLYRRLMGRLGFEIDLDAPVSELPAAQRALVAVLRAVRVLGSASSDGSFRHVFVLDEPTAALSGQDSGIVLGLMRRMADLGAGVLFISHRLGEVIECAGTVTVLRDGRVVASGPTVGMSRADIVMNMLGRKLEEFFPTPGAIVSGPPTLRLAGLSGAVVDDLDLEVAPGEVLGVAGLAGMGQEELLRLVAGSTRPAAGTVEVGGQDVATGRPLDALRAGIAYVPGNRLRDGCWADGSARENLTIVSVRPFLGPLGLSPGREERYSADRLRGFGVRPPEPEKAMAGFSGGNQQKIVLAKWLRLDPRVVLLDEPTQGVDAGAARDLLSEVHAAADRGAAVVIASGDNELLAAVCHRVVVLSSGRIIAQREGAALTEAALIHACEDETADMR